MSPPTSGGSLRNSAQNCAFLRTVRSSGHHLSHCWGGGDAAEGTGAHTYGVLDRLSGGSGRRGGSSGSAVSGCAVGDTDSRTPVKTGRLHGTQLARLPQIPAPFLKHQGGPEAATRTGYVSHVSPESGTSYCVSWTGPTPSWSQRRVPSHRCLNPPETPVLGTDPEKQKTGVQTETREWVLKGERFLISGQRWGQPRRPSAGGQREEITLP